MEHIRLKTIRKTAALLLAIAALFSLTACGGASSAGTSSGGAGAAAPEPAADAREIIVCAAPGFVPMTYEDEDGKAAGYDVEVMKAVDELLDEYTFTYELADKETMNVGVQTGTYQIGINMLFWSEARAETYNIPEQNMGNVEIVLLYRESDPEPVRSLQDVYDRGLKIAPTGPSGGIPQVVNRWNEAHPDAQVTIDLETGLNSSDQRDGLRNGEYDVIINILQTYNLVSEEERAGIAVSEPVDVIHTYCIINKAETELYQAVSDAVVQLYESGKLTEISERVFGYDLFKLQKQ